MTRNPLYEYQFSWNVINAYQELNFFIFKCVVSHIIMDFYSHLFWPRSSTSAFRWAKLGFMIFFQLYRLLNTSWPRNWSFTMGRWGHKLDLVICFDRRSMRLNCILHDLFRDCTCTCERNSLWLTLVHSDSLLLTLALSDPLMLYL